MIAGWHSWSEDARPRLEPIERALALHRDGPPQSQLSARHLLSAASGAALGNAGEIAAAFHGWIDNADELASELGLHRPAAGDLYAAAVARWGADADRRIVGSYAAIATLPDGALRLARSPWDAPPLYYHLTDLRALASPLLRVLFAGGAPQRLDYDRVIDELAYDWRSGDEQGWYHDIWMVPLGATVRIEGTRRQVDRWHQAPLPMPHSNYREDEAVEQACALLDEAAAKALAWSPRPALALSGGLDSPLVASALLRQLAPGERLTALTFVPDRDWDGSLEPGTMGDETPLVRDFVSANPRMDWHVTSDRVGGFDRRAREMFAAMGVFAPGLANVGMFHDVYATARRLGCDSLLVADFGNSTFSDAGGYAYCEFARSGHWRQVLQLLRNREGDARPLWRKIAALSVLPQFPAPIRAMVRKLVHPERHDMVALLTPLSADARQDQQRRARERGSRSGWAEFSYDRSRAEAVVREWVDADGAGRDVELGFEQLYGVRRRDVTAYRPLVEFCMSLPARAFAWDGVERRLARLMGVGRLPESIRTNPLHGQHNVDWHARISRERAAMRACFETARGHPWLSQTLNLDRMTAMLDQWPDRQSFVVEEDWPRMLALPRALLAARFIGAVEGRNDL